MPNPRRYRWQLLLILLAVLLYWPVYGQDFYGWGGLLNEVAIVLFLLVTAVTVIRGQRKGRA